jgi:hypothetical protein
LRLDPRRRRDAPPEVDVLDLEATHRLRPDGNRTPPRCVKKLRVSGSSATRQNSSASCACTAGGTFAETAAPTQVTV